MYQARTLLMLENVSCSSIISRCGRLQFESELYLYEARLEDELDKLQRDPRVPQEIKWHARMHAQKLADHAVVADRAAAERKPFNKRPPAMHPVLDTYMSKAAEEREKAEKTARDELRKAAVKKREEEIKGAGKALPEFTKEHESRADDMADLAADYYRTHKEMQEAHDNHEGVLTILDKNDPDVIPYKDRHLLAQRDHDVSRRALKDGMDKAGIDPRHIERVLQPSVHNIHPRAHMDAVANFFGGEDKDNGYAFNRGATIDHAHFLAWARIHHPNLVPYAVKTQSFNHVRFEKNKPRPVGVLSPEDYKKRFEARTPEEKLTKAEKRARDAENSRDPVVAMDAILFNWGDVRPLRSTGKHHFYLLPNGYTFTRSKTPSAPPYKEASRLRKLRKLPSRYGASASMTEAEAIISSTILVLESLFGAWIEA